MQGFNDYMRLTRGYLKDYRRMESSVDAWEAERKDILAELSTVPVAISKYGGEPGGGTNELTPVERQAERNGKLETRLSEIEHDVKELRSVMRKIESAVSVLDSETQQLVWEHYVDGIAWYGVADKLYISESCIRQRGHRAVCDIATNLFGLKAKPYEQVVLIA